MRTTLEALYFGRIAPYDKSIDKDSKYHQIATIAGEEYNKLKDQLNEEQKAILDKYITADATAQTELQLDAFISGVRFGVRFLIDALIQDDYPEKSSNED